MQLRSSSHLLSSDAYLLLKELLQKDSINRLGCGPRGRDEIKGHKWFRPINWKKLEAREIQPSFLPEVSGKHCIANFEECWTNMPVSDSPAASPKCAENPFKGFTCVKPADPFISAVLKSYDVKVLLGPLMGL